MCLKQVPMLSTLPRRLCGLLAATAVTLASGAALGLWVPATHGSLVAEDEAVECLTVLVLVAAFAIAAWGLRGGFSGRARHVIPGGLALLFALDELSFGQRLFGFEAPRVHGIPIDGVHDLVDLAVVAGRSLLQDRSWLGAAVGGLLFGFAVLLWRNRNPLRGRLAAFQPAPEVIPLLAAMAVFLVIAQTIDLFAHGSLALVALEEMLELNAGLALLLAVLPGRQASPPPAHLGATEPHREDNAHPLEGSESTTILSTNP